MMKEFNPLIINLYSIGLSLHPFLNVESHCTIFLDVYLELNVTLI